MIGTAAELTTWAAGRGLTLTDDDDALENALTVATARLVQLCCRPLELTDKATVSLVGDGTSTLLIPEMTEVTGVTVNGADLSDDLYRVLPLNEMPKTALQLKYGATWLNDGDIVVSGTLGYHDPLPADLVEACYLLAAEMLTNQTADIAGLKKTVVLGVTVEYDSAAQAARVSDLVRWHRKVNL